MSKTFAPTQPSWKFQEITSTAFCVTSEKDSIIFKELQACNSQGTYKIGAVGLELSNYPYSITNIKAQTLDQNIWFDQNTLESLLTLWLK